MKKQNYVVKVGMPLFETSLLHNAIRVSAGDLVPGASRFMPVFDKKKDAIAFCKDKKISAKKHIQTIFWEAEE